MADDVKPLVDVSELEEFQAHKGEVAQALQEALPYTQAGAFKSREEAGAASDAIKELRHTRKQLEDWKLETTAPWRASTTHVNNH
jgi:hypothetical protein